MENIINKLLQKSIIETEELIKDVEIIDGVEPEMFIKRSGLVDSYIK